MNTFDRRKRPRTAETDRRQLETIPQVSRRAAVAAVVLSLLVGAAFTFGVAYLTGQG